MNKIYRVLEWIAIVALFINIVFGIIIPLIKMKQVVKSENSERKKLLHKILYALFLCVVIIFAILIFGVLYSWPM